MRFFAVAGELLARFFAQQQMSHVLGSVHPQVEPTASSSGMAMPSSIKKLTSHTLPTPPKPAFSTRCLIPT
jgi:hypothetical protein